MKSISHVLETRKFVMAILHWKQGLLCDKCPTGKHLQMKSSDLKFLFGRAENIMLKEINTSYHRFSFYLTVFKCSFFKGSLRIRIIW